MYDIIELSKKSQEDLIAIAKELSVKKPESIKKEDLIYVILDEQAIQSKENPVKKTRKRQPKSAEKAPAQPKEAAPATAPAPEEAQAAAEKPAPKKRSSLKRGWPM